MVAKRGIKPDCKLENEARWELTYSKDKVGIILYSTKKRLIDYICQNTFIKLTNLKSKPHIFLLLKFKCFEYVDLFDNDKWLST